MKTSFTWPFRTMSKACRSSGSPARGRPANVRAQPVAQRTRKSCVLFCGFRADSRQRSNSASLPCKLSRQRPLMRQFGAQGQGHKVPGTGSVNRHGNGLLERPQRRGWISQIALNETEIEPVAARYNWLEEPNKSF
jgi:hypothetical protein